MLPVIDAGVIEQHLTLITLFLSFVLIPYIYIEIHSIKDKKKTRLFFIAVALHVKFTEHWNND